jgi:hypothetical protein
MGSPCCLCVCMFIAPVIATQRRGKHVSAAKITHATVEKLLDAIFSAPLVSYQSKLGDFFLHRTACFVCTNYVSPSESTTANCKFVLI